MLTCDKAASIGNLNDSFIKSIYLAAQGIQTSQIYVHRILGSTRRSIRITAKVPLQNAVLGRLEDD
jgi:hypothetical protein